MREINFRGKRVDNGEWAYGCFAEFVNYLDGDTKPGIQVTNQVPSGFDRMIPAFETELVDVIPETVGQYTGIKDKNGVEIFEGDIVKMYCSFKDIYGTSLETHEDEITIIGVVRIDMTTGMYLEVDDETENYYWHEFYRDPAEHFEIIGNIYENPELLNEEQTGGTERKEREE